MKFFVIVSLAVIGTLTSITVYPQERDRISLDKIIPPSPEIAQLGKYGFVPVNHSTGAISVEIPVFTINTPRFKWPVSFSYHGSGIRVDETPTSVGSGWSLTAIGAVNRNIVGAPDESTLLTGNWPTKVTQLTGLTLSAWLSTVSTLSDGVGEPDLFNFNFLDKSGTFQVDKQKGVVVQSDQNLRVKFNSGSSIEITDETSNIYSFNSYESTVSRMHGPNGAALPGGDVLDGITGWYLTKALSYDRSDSIVFQYGTSYEVVQELDQYSFKVGETAQFLNYCVTGNQIPSIERTGIQRTRTMSPGLTAIIFRNGKLVMNYVNDRKDMGWGWGNMGRLASIDIYRNNKGTYEHFQKVRLHQNYFVSPERPPLRDTSLAYRLKLDSVTVVNPAGALLSRGYQLSYNSTPLPYRTSPRQDFWGYANNGTSNTNLVPRRIFLYGTQVYDIGTADRNADSTKMQAGSLQRITYPTGGYSEFVYEPHKFWDPQLISSVHPPNTPVIQIEEKATAVPPSPTNIARKWFVHTGPSQTVTFNAFFTAYAGKSDAPPYVKIRQGAGPSFINELTLTSPNANADQTVSASYTLLNGYTYHIEAYVHAGSYPVNEVSSRGWLYRDSLGTPDPGGETSTGGYRTVGGLRIAKITHYSADGNVATKEVYSYGAEGEGVLVGNLAMLHRHYRNIKSSITGTTDLGYCHTCRFSYRSYSDQSPYALSTMSGSIVAYSTVWKYMVDNTGKNLGAQQYQYEITADDYDIVPQYDNFFSLAKPWRNGKMTRETTFGSADNGNFYELNSKAYEYQDIKLDTIYNIGVVKNFGALCNNLESTDFTVYQNRKYYGRRLPSRVITTTMASGPENQALKMIDTVQFQYSPAGAHLNPIITTRRESNSSPVLQNAYYAEDMIRDLGDNGGGIYPLMVQNGLTGMPVLIRELKNSTQTMESKTEYASPYGTFIKPVKFYQKLGAFPVELYKEISYLNNGNLSQQSMANNVKISYLWGYDAQFPIAEITNALAKDAFHTSFEDTDGNASAGDAKSGLLSRTGGYSKALSDLSNGTYTLSYWQKSSGSWQLYSQEVTVSAGTFTISLSGQLDDIRFYPKAAQMTTYTYDPLLGQTSRCDASGRYQYFEYDAFGRLSVIRGTDLMILKYIRYNYAGQPEM